MAKKIKDKPNKKKNALLGSVMFRAWLAFLALILGIMAVFWAGELVIFSSNYTDSYTAIVNERGKTLMRSLENNSFLPESDSFRALAKDSATNYRMTVIVFTFSDGGDVLSPYDANVEFFTNPFYASGDLMSDFQEARSILSEQFLLEMSKIDGAGAFVHSDRTKDVITVVRGAKAVVNTGRTVYLYVSSDILVNDTGANIMMDQLKTVTVICLIFAILASVVIAWLLVRPIQQFIATARKMGEGDVTVKYTGNGYIEFDELADALNYANAEMIKAEKFRGDFLTNVTHDLRTPLTLVKANAEMIRDLSGDNKEKRNRNVAIIINEVDRLTLLVTDILDLSKLQSGVAEFKKEKAAIGSIISEVVSQFDVLAESGNYVFETDIDKSLLVECDNKRLTQVVYNLVGNAVNYVGEDRMVLVKAFKTAFNTARVEISDHGAGIPPEEIDKVWERYYRSNRKQRNVVGSGIGLSIVKNILIGIGAKYGIDSVQGGGTTFWFELPLMDEEKKA